MFLSNVGKIFKNISFSFDLFRAPANLRAKGKPDVSRICPGLLSLALGILFIWAMVSNVLKILRYEQIETSLIYEVKIS